MGRFRNLGDVKSIIFCIFPGEDELQLVNASKLLEKYQRERFTFNEVIRVAIEEFCGEKLCDDSLDFDSIWEKFLKAKFKIDDYFIEEYADFLKCPDEWAEVIESVGTKENAVEVAKTLLAIASGKIEGFKQMVEQMEFFSINDKGFYIYKTPELPYYLTKPESIAEYCIIIRDDCYEIKRIDGKTLELNPEWLHPLANLENYFKPLNISEIEISPEYEEMLSETSLMLEFIDNKVVRAGSLSDAVRFLQNITSE